MKKFKIAAGVLAAVMAVAAAGCAGSDKSGDNNTPAVAAVAKGEAPVTNIRYIDLDSVLANYTLAQELSKESQKMMLDYQNVERQKGNELQKLGNQIQQKVNSSGYLSQESYQADVNSFNQKQNEAQNFLAAQQNRISTYMAAQQNRLNDSIQNFIKVYNATHNYDAILYREAGVFFNPVLNITDEVVKGLNERYRPQAAETK